MQYNFEESSLVIGQIKELLHNFNLPMVPVWNDNIIFGNTKVSPSTGRVYIKDGKIQRYTSLGWVVLSDYLYNREIANFTKNLTINSSVYDNYTHEYLGDYLRFIRDYHKIDLMSLYNCFGEKKPSRLYKKIESDKANITLDTDLLGYNYYIVPVRFNQPYTIAIDAPTRYEICCLFYSDNFVSSTPDELIINSYKSVGGSKFIKPFVYNTNFIDNNTYWTKEKNLVMLLKLPREINSSIVILEGDYSQCSNVVDGTLVCKFNKFDTSISGINSDDSIKRECSSKLSLLRVNNGKSYPFADRLVEYLLGNAITPIDSIDSNIERVQDSLYDSLVGNYGIWDGHLSKALHDEIVKQDLTKGKNIKYGNIIGVGDKDDIDSSGAIVYEDTQPLKRFIDVYHDVIGYVDKDTETMLEVNANEL